MRCPLGVGSPQLALLAGSTETSHSVGSNIFVPSAVFRCAEYGTALASTGFRTVQGGIWYGIILWPKSTSQAVVGP